MVRGLAGEGRSAAEIAAVIGSTAASVRVRCCQLRIKLRRGRPASSGAEPGTRRGPKLVVYVGPARYAALTQKAAHLQRSTVELAEQLLGAIIGSELYEAVLDDRG